MDWVWGVELGWTGLASRARLTNRPVCPSINPPHTSTQRPGAAAPAAYEPPKGDLYAKRAHTDRIKFHPSTPLTNRPRPQSSPRIQPGNGFCPYTPYVFGALEAQPPNAPTTSNNPPPPPLLLLGLKHAAPVYPGGSALLGPEDGEDRLPRDGVLRVLIGKNSEAARGLAGHVISTPRFLDSGAGAASGNGEAGAAAARVCGSEAYQGYIAFFPAPEDEGALGALGGLGLGTGVGTSGGDWREVGVGGAGAYARSGGGGGGGGGVRTWMPLTRRGFNKAQIDWMKLVGSYTPQDVVDSMEAGYTVVDVMDDVEENIRLQGGGGGGGGGGGKPDPFLDQFGKR